jgi:hypothetical protein
MPPADPGQACRSCSILLARPVPHTFEAAASLLSILGTACTGSELLGATLSGMWIVPDKRIKLAVAFRFNFLERVHEVTVRALADPALELRAQLLRTTVRRSGQRVAIAVQKILNRSRAEIGHARVW